MDKGAHFYKCDFQVHTPRDLNWTGAACVTDEERRNYATSLVQACRERGLQGIAVTDHHDMAFVSFIRRAATDETDGKGNPIPVERQLVVFPGMELTLGVPCQALLIFDAEFPEDLFALAMTALAINPSPGAQSKSAQIERLHTVHSLLQLRSELDKHTYLKERYIILPHVGENGQFSLIRKGQAGKYTEMPCVGGYMDGDLTKLGEGKREILAGRNKEWGHKRIACFQTSDNRFEDHRDLGKSTTWVKWAVPTAEALRQACLAQESRVSQEQPRLPAVVVGSISVSNSTFLGPIDLELNSQYTALIGGRGTGKSTILEYLRWALCDQPPGGGDEDTPNYQARRARLIEQTLKPVNATVQIRFELNTVPHIVRRSSADGSLLIKIGTDDFRPCQEDEVRALLPIHAYSQKQLSDVSVRVDELSRFITAPIRTELARIERQTDERAVRVRQSYVTRRRQRTLEQALRQRELEEKSLTEQADAIRAGLTGLTIEDRALLERGRLFDAASRSVQSWLDGIASIRKSVQGLRELVDSHLGEIAAVPSDVASDILQRAQDEYLALLTNAKAALEALEARANAASAMGDTASPWRLWTGALAEFRSAYDSAAVRSSAHKEKMKQLQTIEDQLATQARETARMRDELRGLASAETAYRTERHGWEALLKERDDLLDAQCKTLTQNSGGAIRAQLRRFADSTDFVNGLRQALSGSRIQGGKIEKIGEVITTAGDGTGRLWNALLEDLEKLAEIDTEREGPERRPETPALVAAGFSAGDLDRVTRSLNQEEWLALSLTAISSLPIFEYRAREGEYIAFRNASAGQQATALLKTLLNQDGPPLIIDQPEEDLDNPVMIEIVEQIWRAKQKRQIIFASHNANLVVNGDAELVAWCDHRAAGDQSRGTIAGEGAIDMVPARDAIKRIMEGGEAAFNLRKEKYGF
ncbi:MAG TPA: AAA family ATPase [Bryobacteraceae bacterium]|nr:AAA family ATPase [Bryobacteraceae bacterium]